MKLILSFAVLLTTSSAILAVSTNPFFKTDFYKNTFSSHSTRIVGGEDAKEHIPYIGSLREKGGAHICGAILIDTRTVLTAKSCVNFETPENYEVVLGILKLSETKPKNTISVDQIICPENCDDPSKGIAVLKFGKAVDTTDPGIKPIRLPTADTQCDIATKTVTLSGWGYKYNWDTDFPDNLRFVTLKGITVEECKQNLEHLLGRSGPLLLDDTMICAIGAELPNESACKGDTGGPLVLLVDENRANDVLVGIMSWGITPCGFTKAPSVFTNVCKFLEFIDDKSESAPEPEPEPEPEP